MSCAASELPEEWRDLKVLMRTTTLTYESMEVDYVPEGLPWIGSSDEQLTEWSKVRPWFGQAVFVLQGKVAGAGGVTTGDRNVSSFPSEGEKSRIQAESGSVTTKVCPDSGQPVGETCWGGSVLGMRGWIHSDRLLLLWRCHWIMWSPLSLEPCGRKA